MRGFFTRMTGMLLCMCVYLAGSAHASFADDMTLTEAFFTQPEQYSGLVEVPGKGTMRYYAQNDPLWGGLTYERAETPSGRPFRDGGCGPTAGAMAVANLLPEEELSRIASAAKQEYSLCPCSLNKGKCIHYHARYVLTSQRDFVRFLPLVFGDFATGNNRAGVHSRGESQGTGTGFLYEIAKVYGITITATVDYDEAIRAMLNGDTVVGHASRGGALTNTGHYVLLAHIDEERLYILDPLCRTNYSGYPDGKKVEIIQPGLIAFTHENVKAANMGMFMIFHRD
ncbi:MAG: hypothetical protein IKO52_01220 [Clostridia bacterium]|nr:hypothetical protein [Clostridia bacterium]